MATRAVLLAICALLLVAWILRDRDERGAEEQDAVLTRVEESRPGVALEGAPGPDVETRRRTSAERVVSDAAVQVVVGRVVDVVGSPLGGVLVGDLDRPDPIASEEDGSFRLERPRGAPPFRMLLLAEGHAPQVVPIALDPVEGLRDLGELALADLWVVRGRCKDGRGAPVPGAWVEVLPASSTSPWSEAVLATLFPRAEVDADGRFRLVGLPVGAFRLRAGAPGYRGVRTAVLELDERGGSRQVERIVLQEGFTLRGRVLDEHVAALPGAEVRAIRSGAALRDVDPARTDEQGEFALTGLPPVTIDVEVRFPGYRPASWEGIDLQDSFVRSLEIEIWMGWGYSAHGVVRDATTGAPVESYAASIHRMASRTDELDARNLARAAADRLAELDATPVEDEASGQIRRLREELGAIEDRARSWERDRPRAPRGPAPPIEEHPGGRFAFQGLDAGVYVVGIRTDAHRYVESEPFRLDERTSPHELELVVVPGGVVRGVVVSKADGSPVADAQVELRMVLQKEPALGTEQRPLFPWLFAPPAPRGLRLEAVRTEADGRFAFLPPAPGPCYLHVRGPHLVETWSAPFEASAFVGELRLAVGARSVIEGTVLDAAAAGARGVEVLVLGGHGEQRMALVDGKGRYRIEGLAPGGYYLRAFPSGSALPVSRFFASLFPLHAGAVDPAALPPLDLRLGEGETVRHDLSVELPATGVVRGEVRVNGEPRSGQVVLRPIDAPATGGLAIWGRCDDLGRFEFQDVPIGSYRFQVRTLHEEELHLERGAIETLSPRLLAGGLALRCRAIDADRSDPLQGSLWILPGANEAPTDLYEYRRSHRVIRIGIREGEARAEELPVGAALLVVELPERERVLRSVVIEAGRTTVVDDVEPERRR